MLIALFIWILFGVWIIVCMPGVMKIIKSTIDGLNFWLSVLYIIIIYLFERHKPHGMLSTDHN